MRMKAPAWAETRLVSEAASKRAHNLDNNNFCSKTTAVMCAADCTCTALTDLCRLVEHADSLRAVGKCRCVDLVWACCCHIISFPGRVPTKASAASVAPCPNLLDAADKVLALAGGQSHAALV